MYIGLLIYLVIGSIIAYLLTTKTTMEHIEDSTYLEKAAADALWYNKPLLFILLMLIWPVVIVTIKRRKDIDK